MSTKSDNIKATLKATKERRKSQTCHVYEIKVDKARLSASQRLSLAQLFREAKWFWNAALASESFFDFDPSVKEVAVKVGDGYETRPLTLLSSQMKQSLIGRMKDAVRVLHTRKLKGYKVGALKFKSYVNSLPLKQFGNTFRIQDDQHLKIQNLPGSLSVHGLGQLKDAEIANANLVRRGSDYFVMVTAYHAKVEDAPKPYGCVGIDFNIGAGHQLVLHNGVAIGFDVAPHNDPRIKKAQRKLARQDRTNKKRGVSKHTRNRSKTRARLQTLHAGHKNKKKEIRNQVVSRLMKLFAKQCFQQESLAGWQRLWGKRVLGTALAEIIGRLNTSPTAIVTPRFVATTQTCHVCGHRNQDITLSDQWWTCPKCRTRHNRHTNAAKNMLPRQELSRSASSAV
ncbi:MAG: putative transposase, family protein [Chthonomonadaceae bacterium]|nr:putative transposase, family protein [Chthonomonadaceae bacterium]